MALVELTPTHSSTPDDLPRNGRGQPLVYVPERDKMMTYTRMTTFIDCVDDKTALANWGRRMAVVGVSKLDAERLTQTLAQVREAAERDDRKRLDEITEELVELAGIRTKATRGTWLHELSQYVDRNDVLPMIASEQDVIDMAAYKLATVDMQVKQIEQHVVLDELKIAGTPDRVSFYDGLDPDGEPAGHLITDLKTGRTDYGGLKMSMQLAGYSRSTLYDHVTHVRTPMPADLNQRWGLIMHLIPGTGVCEVFWIDLTIGWAGVELARDIRAYRRKGKLVFRPFTDPLAHAAEADDEGDE